MSLAIDLAALCEFGGENGINRSHLAVFSEDVALPITAWLPAHLHPIGVLVVLGMPVQDYLKW